jgi:hypothetical protein
MAPQPKETAMKLGNRIAILISLAVLPLAAFALDPEVMNTFKEAKANAAHEIQKLNRLCGTSMTMTIDEPSFTASPDRVEAARWCGQIPAALSNFCEQKSPSYISGTAKKVKAITCKYDPSLSRDQNNAVKYVIKDGTLTGSINKDSSNIHTNLTLDKSFLAGLKE